MPPAGVGDLFNPFAPIFQTKGSALVAHSPGSVPSAHCTYQTKAGMAWELTVNDFDFVT